LPHRQGDSHPCCWGFRRHALRQGKSRFQSFSPIASWSVRIFLHRRQECRDLLHQKCPISVHWSFSSCSHRPRGGRNGSRPPPELAPPARHPASTRRPYTNRSSRSEEHTSELQSRENLVCRL